MATDPNNLGPKVTSRDYNWLDMVTRAWGSEFRAPDHGIYDMGNGRKFDSTDKGLTGIYGVNAEDDKRIVAYDARYPDMRDGFYKNLGADQPLGAQNNGLGSFDELILDNSPIPYPFAPPPAVETDPYFANVSILLHNDLTDYGPYSIPVSPTTGPGLLVPVTNAPLDPFGTTNAIASPNSGTTNGQVHASHPALNLFDAPTNALVPFTIEYSIYLDTTGPSLYGSSMSQVSLYAGISPSLYSIIQGSGYSFGALQPKVWYQIALCFAGKIPGSVLTAQAYTFVNGKLVTTTTGAFSGGLVNNEMGIFCMAFAGYPKTTGYIKEFRVTKGIQRYGADYTPRTTPFPNS